MADNKCSVKMGFDGDRLFADISGEVDHHGVSDVRDRIDTEMYRTRPKQLVINLERVGFMDSSGLGLIVGRVKLAEDLGCFVSVVGADKRIMKIFELAGLSRLPGLVVEGAVI